MSEQSLNYKERYEALLLELNSLKPEILSTKEEAFKLRRKCNELAEEKELLQRKMVTNVSRESVSHLKLEIELLREKVLEMNALILEKDKALEQVFNSKTFKIGKVITSTAKLVKS